MKLIYQADNSNRTAVFSDGLRVLSGVGKRCVVYTQVENEACKTSNGVSPFKLRCGFTVL